MLGEALGNEEYQGLRRGNLVTGVSDAAAAKNTLLELRFIYLVHSA
jgi:hypothetical protein